MSFLRPQIRRPGFAYQAVIEALEETGLPVVFTLANADPGGRAINAEIRKYAVSKNNVILVENFGLIPFFSVMSYASAMVGNSSSGIRFHSSLTYLKDTYGGLGLPHLL